MQVITNLEKITYIASTGDWRIVVADGIFEILPQVGGWEYSSGTNLDNLAAFIVEAKADAVERGINWSNT
jgi:hypothetical protein